MLFRSYFYLTSITEMLRERIRQGSGQPNLNTEIVRSLPAPFPPAGEQAEIVKFLIASTARVDDMIIMAESAVTLLMEYRSALITSAVTGRIDVREDAA